MTMTTSCHGWWSTTSPDASEVGAEEPTVVPVGPGYSTPSAASRWAVAARAPWIVVVPVL